MSSPDPKAAALRALRQAHQTRLAADRAEVEAVAHARQAGASWTEIAAEVGQQRQNAERKYKPLLDERRTVVVRQPQAPSAEGEH